MLMIRIICLLTFDTYSIDPWKLHICKHAGHVVSKKSKSQKILFIVGTL